MSAIECPDRVQRYIDSLNVAIDEGAEGERVKNIEDAAERIEGPAECSGDSRPPLADGSLDEPSLPALVDLLLKDQPALDRLTRVPHLQQALIPKFLWIGVLGYTIFGAGLALVFTSAGLWPELTPTAAWLANPSGGLIRFVATDAAWQPWWDGSALVLIAAFTLGLIGAIGVCLPSFYFYGLLAGVKPTMLEVTAHATKGMASAAIAVVGVLPIYVAIVLGILVLGADAAFVTAQCFLGLVLPFIAGLWGTRSLYISFVGLTDRMSPAHRSRRASFLRRLMFSWCACFTAVTPVMIYTLWEFLA